MRRPGAWWAAYVWSPVWYLTVSFLTGFAWEGFMLCAVCAILTGSAHAVRLAVALRANRAQK